MLENIPSQSTLTELIGQSLFEVWQALCSAIDEKYDMERLWNTGGKNWTYEYKYRRGGKTLCGRVRPAGGYAQRAGTTRGKSQGLLRRGHSFYLINGRKKPLTAAFFETARSSGITAFAASKGFKPDRTRCYAAALRGDVLSIRICKIALPQNEIIAQGSPAHIHNLDSARRGRPRPTGRMT